MRIKLLLLFLICQLFHISRLSWENSIREAYNLKSSFKLQILKLCTNLSAEADNVLPHLFGLSLITLPQCLHQHALLPLLGERWFNLLCMLLRGVAGDAVFGLAPVDEGACWT